MVLFGISPHVILRALHYARRLMFVTSKLSTSGVKCVRNHVSWKVLSIEKIEKQGCPVKQICSIFNPSSVYLTFYGFLTVAECSPRSFSDPRFRVLKSEKCRKLFRHKKNYLRGSFVLRLSNRS